MAHQGTLGQRQLSDSADDIRGTTVRGSNDEKLGTVDDVILDHDTMEIRYVVVDSGGWLEAGAFIVPVERITEDERHSGELNAHVSKDDVKGAPQYDEKRLNAEDDWKRYEQEFKKYWEEDPVMHMKGTDRIITPPEEPAEQTTSAGTGSGATTSRPIDAAQLFPERMTNVFPDPEPSGSKVTLRPRSVARAEEAAQGVTLLKPRWWESFENYLRENREKVQQGCEQCGSETQRGAA